MTALVDTTATLRALAGLATAYADRARCAGIDVAAGSALAGWWVERAAHPGTTAVTDVLAATRQRFMLGVTPGADHVLRMPGGKPYPFRPCWGLHIWHRAVTSGPVLPGLDAIREDDDWLLEGQQDALNDQRTWDRPESLHIAAARTGNPLRCRRPLRRGAAGRPAMAGTCRAHRIRLPRRGRHRCGRARQPAGGARRTVGHPVEIRHGCDRLAR